MLSLCGGGSVLTHHDRGGSSLERIRIGLCLALSLWAFACGGKKPDSEQAGGKRILLSTEFHDELAGAQASKQMEAEMGLVRDPALVAYVTAIGKRLVPFGPRTGFDFTFHIVDQATPNAFALPGGYVYVSRGLLQLAGSEDELACVIGHEITHAGERHSAARQERARRLNPFSMGYMRAASIAGYSRDQERDADRGGQIMAAHAGYDPMGMASFLRDLGNMERLAVGWSRLPSFFASHPGTPERAATATDRARNLAWQRQPPIAGSQEGFLRRLEGLVLGPNPREGVFQGTRFLHPDMDFTLRFPEGWHLVNTPRAVGAVEPEGKAQVSVELAGVGDDPAKAARAFIEGRMREVRATLDSSQPVRIGDLPGWRVEGRARMPGGAVHGQITFVAWRGFVFRINGLALSGDVDKYRGRLHSVARSFRGLLPEERASIRTVRLHVAQALEGESLEQLGSRTGNVLDVPTTAILNDVFVDARLARGRWLKIGVSEPYQPEPSRPPSLEMADDAAEPDS